MRDRGGDVVLKEKEDQVVEVVVGPGVGDRVRRTGKTNSAGGLAEGGERVEEGGEEEVEVKTRCNTN